ncbi:MAG: acyloxyacyl hydrolase [Thermodesulfobacteriota bacterium]
MRGSFLRGISALLVAVFLWMPDSAGGEGFDFTKFNQEVGLRFGYGKSLRKASVHLYSFFPRWGIFLVKPGTFLPGGLGVSAVVEGILSIADAEQTGSEFGFTPMLKLSLPVHQRLLFFIEGGAGLIAENFNSPAIAHTFNFTPQVGGGVDIALKPNLAFTLAYRFRHSSNAGLYDQNPAFDVHFFQGGLTYYY